MSTAKQTKNKTQIDKNFSVEPRSLTFALALGLIVSTFVFALGSAGKAHPMEKKWDNSNFQSRAEQFQKGFTWGSR